MLNRTMLALAVVGLVAGCGSGEVPAPTAGRGPKPRPDDPKLEQSWTMPAETSVVKRADLGTVPADAAAKMMEGGRMPSVTHRVAQACAQSSSKSKGASDLVAVALRFRVEDGGKLAGIEADPADGGGECFAEGLAREAGTFDGVTASAALLRIEFHGRPRDK